jgi:hypothetical protein
MPDRSWRELIMDDVDVSFPTDIGVSFPRFNRR